MGYIGEKVSSTDLVTITLKGLFPYYKFFISSLATRKDPPTFAELSGIFLQEEERMKHYDHDSQSLEMVLIARKRHSAHRGNQWNRNIHKFHTRKRGMTHSDSYANRNIECVYCGKYGNLTKECFRKKNHEFTQRYRNHN